VKKKCPECGKNKLKRLFGTGAAIVFKGSGFYQTDYRSEGYTKAAKADKESKSDSKSSEQGDSNKGASAKADSSKAESKSTDSGNVTGAKKSGGDGSGGSGGKKKKSGGDS
jgi:predicted nucleic acid-binding Zn ribbon protein